MDKNRFKVIHNFAADERIQILKMIAHLGKGHIGGSMSIADFYAVLYNGQLKCDPKNPQWEDRDYVVMSKGHCGPALYATLALKGFFPMEELMTLNQVGTILPSHCDRNKTPGIDMSTGSLGQGVSAALGMALGLKIAGRNNYVFAVIGDGETQEGQVWETLQLAPAQNASNFIVVLDNNKQQLDDYTDKIVALGDMTKRTEELGWFAIDCDGHDIEAIDDAINQCKASGKPSFINLHTIKGKGWKKIEGDVGNHHMKGLKMDDVADAIKELEASKI